MEQKPHQLPELEELKQLLKDTKNIVFYKRVEFTGSKESVKYMKKKIKEFEILMDTGDSTQISGSI
jgi:heterodisulfide reductase subunit A-like polyferredoxin